MLKITGGCAVTELKLEMDHHVPFSLKSRFGVDAKSRLSRFDLIGLSDEDVRSIRGALG